MKTNRVSDGVPNHWAERILSQKALPYARLMRLERPIGWWLLVLPCWWSSTLAAVAAGNDYPNFWHLFLFLIGAVAMRGAGCTYNDILDRDIDGQVARTRSRPIPSRQVTTRQALIFMIALCLAGLLVLLQFNSFAILLGFGSLGIVAIYPLMKRVTHWPQSVLGLAFSWGALMGWAAWYGSLALPAYMLYAACVLWTIGYDTIYAHQDKEDDAVIGVKSTALLFGAHTKSMLWLFYGVACLLIWLALVFADAGVFSFAGLIGFTLHLCRQIITLDIDDSDACLKHFRSNRDAGLILFAGLLVDSVWSGGFSA
jgi:4-hydroxybenzoate polyprenyltransferase